MKLPLRIHGRTHRPGGSDPIDGLIVFDYDNEGGWLLIATNNTNPDTFVGMGIYNNFGILDLEQNAAEDFRIYNNAGFLDIQGLHTAINSFSTTDTFDLYSAGGFVASMENGKSFKIYPAHLAGGLRPAFEVKGNTNDDVVNVHLRTGQKFVVRNDSDAIIFEVDEDGTITPGGSGSPTGAAGGALDGTYPNPGIASSVAGAGLAETSDVLSVNVDGSTIEINSDTLRVKDEGITEAKLDHSVVDHGSTGSTETIDVTAGTWHRLTLDANCTITVSGFTSSKGLEVLVKVTQDATGGRTITWDPDVTFIGDNQPSTAAASVTYFMLWADAGDTAIYGAKVGGDLVTSVFGRTGAVVAATNDYTDAQVQNSPTNKLTTTGDLLYASAANTLARLGIGSTGQVLTVSGGLPAWGAASSAGQHILLADGHSTPFAFTDCLQLDDGSDFMWSDP